MSIQEAGVATACVAKSVGSRVNHARIQFHRIARRAHEFIAAAAIARVGKHGHVGAMALLRGVHAHAHARPSILNRCIFANLWIEALMSNESRVVVVASQRLRSGCGRLKLRTLHGVERMIGVGGQRARFACAAFGAFKIPGDGANGTCL